jgi:DNA-binding XRE family transcriptional regulator
MSAPTTLGGCALFLFFAGVLVIFPAGHTGKEDAVLAVLVAYPVAAHEAESLHQALIASLAGKPLLIVQLGVVHHRPLGIHRERGGAQTVANLLNVCFIHIRFSVFFRRCVVFVLISSHRWRAFVNRKIYVFTDFFAKSVDLVTSSVYTEGKQKGGHAVAREENTMTTEQLIKVALSYAGMTQAELADKIGMNKSNFNARMKRESFSRIEMEQIAKALGMEFVYTFKMPDGKTI